MSVSRLFTIIGDGNVRRNMTGLNIASREVMKKAQVIDYLGVAPFETALQEIRPESSVCIIAAITDALIVNGFIGTIAGTIDPSMMSFRDKIGQCCVSRPDLQVCYAHIRQLSSKLTSHYSSIS